MAFADAFSRTFIEGFLGLQKIGLEQERLEAERERFGLESGLAQRRTAMLEAQDARAAELHGLELQARRDAAAEAAALPGSLTALYGAAAPQRELSDPQGIGVFQPGRPAARTVPELLERDPQAAANLARVSRLAPASLTPLGLQTPEQQEQSQWARDDRQRKLDAWGQLEQFSKRPQPTTPEEIARSAGEMTGILVKGGLLTGADAAQRMESAWRQNPAQIQDFMGRVGRYADEIRATPEGTRLTPDAVLRQAATRAMTENPGFILANPEFAKMLKLDTIFTPPAVTAIPGGGGAYVQGQGMVMGPPDPSASRPVAVPGVGVYLPETGGRPGQFAVSPPPHEKTTNPVMRMATENAERFWPDANSPQHALARQTFLRLIEQQQGNFLAAVNGNTPEGQQQAAAALEQAYRAADKIANPEKYTAGTVPPPSPGWGATIRNFFSGFRTGAPPIPPEGGPVVVPPPAGVVSPSTLSPGQPTGAAVPGSTVTPDLGPSPPGAQPLPRRGRVDDRGASLSMTLPSPPIGPEGGVTPGGYRVPPTPAPVNPPPPNATAADARAEALRLEAQGVPRNQVRAAMKQAGW